MVTRRLFIRAGLDYCSFMRVNLRDCVCISASMTILSDRVLRTDYGEAYQRVGRRRKIGSMVSPLSDLSHCYCPSTEPSLLCPISILTHHVYTAVSKYIPSTQSTPPFLSKNSGRDSIIASSHPPKGSTLAAQRPSDG